jgi:hypothetical protein
MKKRMVNVHGVMVEARPLQYSKYWYVNPHTRELCCFPIPEGEGEFARAREALEGHGVKERGYWMLNDFLNWGVSAIMRWDFDTYSKPARYLKRHIDDRREKVEYYKQLKKAKA